MANINMTREQPIQQFWEMTDDIRAGMLGVEGSGQHMQPMHPNCDPEGRNLWFYADRKSDLVRAVGDGATAHFCVIGRSHDYHACVRGRLDADRNTQMIQRFWTPVTASWFKGMDDPDLTMLRFALEDGVAWSSADAVTFGWALLKAGVSETEPDVGARQHFSFLHHPGAVPAGAPA